MHNLSIKFVKGLKQNAKKNIRDLFPNTNLGGGGGGGGDGGVFFALFSIHVHGLSGGRYVCLEDEGVVVYEELGHLIGVAWGQVGKEGGATGGGDDARGHEVHIRVSRNLQQRPLSCFST